MSKEVSALVDHLFRHEAGKMVSVLTRLFGIAHLALAEDIVQESLYKALVEWPYRGVPQNPSAWLYTTARNHTLDMLRQQSNRKKLAEANWETPAEEWPERLDILFLDTEIQDSQLRMMFACCNPALAPEVQLGLTLKHLCGFSTREISRALLTGEAGIEKRLQRARHHLREEGAKLEVPQGKALSRRLEVVHRCLYLLFNEGYNSTEAETLIRKDLCYEAMRLCMLLLNNTRTAVPDTHALLALMCFHAARFEARTDEEGCLLPLQEQNRRLWNPQLINQGIVFFANSMVPDEHSAYQLEAGIIALHCVAPDFEKTDWKAIHLLYSLIQRIQDTPVVALNKAIVTAKISGLEAAIVEVESLEDLENYYLYHATLGDLYLQSGNYLKARTFLEKAAELTHSQPEKRHLQKKIVQCRIEMSFME